MKLSCILTVERSSQGISRGEEMYPRYHATLAFDLFQEWTVRLWIVNGERLSSVVESERLSRDDVFNETCLAFLLTCASPRKSPLPGEPSSPSSQQFRRMQKASRQKGSGRRGGRETKAVRRNDITSSFHADVSRGMPARRESLVCR